MKISLLIMLLAFIVISYLSIPGAIGIFPANAYSILLQRLIASSILLIIVIYYGNREFLSSIFIVTFSSRQMDKDSDNNGNPYCAVNVCAK